MSVLPLATFSAPGVPYFGSGGGGSTYTAGSNIAINNSNVISVATNPSFTNINAITLNSNAIPPTYTAGTNIAIANNAISVAGNPTFSNVNLTTINGQPYTPGGGGGGGYTKSIIPLNTIAFPAPTYRTTVTGGGAFATLSQTFNLTIDRYYRISIPSIWAENSATNNNTKSEGILIALQYAGAGGGAPSAWFGMIPWDTNMPFSFSLTFKAQDTAAVINLINNGTTSSDITWVGGNTNVMVLEDMGTIP